MAKFTSFDGVDKNGVRAEVNVMTGTGKVKEIVGRGRAAEDGTFRNVEIVFEPDNPLLKRKVYGMLDTTATELDTYARAALDDQRTVSFRIESQRKRGVDRTKKFEDLEYTEEVIRVIAGLDAVYSHEAKTDPEEDPSNENPSALKQNNAAATRGVGQATNGVAVNLDTVLASLAEARAANLSETVVDVLIGHALAAGATIIQVTRPVADEGGREDFCAAQVARAAQAEQFALDYLVAKYSEGMKNGVDVTDTMLAQAAALGFALLDMADTVQVSATGNGAPDRQKGSYSRALDLVVDAVDKRYPVPLGDGEKEQQEWVETVTTEAAERLYGIGCISSGSLPQPEAERDIVEPPVVDETPEVSDVSETAEDSVSMDMLAELEPTEISDEPSEQVVDIADARSSELILAMEPTYADDGFVAPPQETILRLKQICVDAELMGDTHAIGNWLEDKTGQRVSRNIHAPILEEFVTFYENAGTNKTISDVHAVASHAA